MIDFTNKPTFSVEIFNAVKLIYEELSSDDLLNRCIGGFTQNSNESFNATGWSMVPKSVSCGKSVLDIAANLSVCIYNDGLSSIMHIMQALDITIGSNYYNFCVENDERRIKFSERSLTDAVKAARQSLKSIRKEEEEDSVNLEGQMYVVLD